LFVSLRIDALISVDSTVQGKKSGLQSDSKRATLVEDCNMEVLASHSLGEKMATTDASVSMRLHDMSVRVCEHRYHIGMIVEFATPA